MAAGPVQFTSGVSAVEVYVSVTDPRGEPVTGLTRADFTVEEDGTPQVIACDHVVVCAGQESVRALYDELVSAGRAPHLIGGADVAAELDAERAIDQATRLALTL